MNKLILFVLTLAFTQNSFSHNSSVISGDFELASMEVVEISDDKNDNASEAPEKNILDEIVYTVDTLIAVGKKIYSVVDAGRPVVNTKFNNVSVLPKLDSGETVNAFYDMEGWSKPVHKKYKITFKNIYGIEVVSFLYGVSMQHGGTYQDSGAYVLAANIYPVNLNVLWGWNLDATVETVSIANTGTSGDPVASIQLRLDGKVSTPINENKFSHVFHLTGNGQINSNL